MEPDRLCVMTLNIVNIMKKGIDNASYSTGFILRCHRYLVKIIRIVHWWEYSKSIQEVQKYVPKIKIYFRLWIIYNISSLITYRYFILNNVSYLMSKRIQNRSASKEETMGVTSQTPVRSMKIIKFYILLVRQNHVDVVI